MVFILFFSHLFICRVKQEYRDGAKNFVEMARRSANRDLIICPCKKCLNHKYHPTKIVYEHLVINGMEHTYINWVFHGESPKNVHTK